MVKFRNSARNTDPAISPALQVDPNFNCENIYYNVTTTMPFFFYSRWSQGNTIGNYGDDAYLGQGFFGNAAAGNVWYNGTSYPEMFRNSIFIIDYAQFWIKVLSVSGDTYTGITDFLQLADPVVTLEIEPIDGNLVYNAIDAGELHMIKYLGANNPPVAVANAFPSSGLTPLKVQFSSDGTIDEEDSNLTVSWNFGDGSPTSNLMNPSHTYTTQGVFTVTFTVVDTRNLSSIAVITINTNIAAPVVSIVSPTTTNVLGYYNEGDEVNFACTVKYNGDANNLTYAWSANLAHNNHFHLDAYSSNLPSFSVILSDVGAEIPSPTVRVDIFIKLTVTSPEGLSGYDYIFVTRSGETWFSNTAPVPSFSVPGNLICFFFSSFFNKIYIFNYLFI